MKAYRRSFEVGTLEVVRRHFVTLALDAANLFFQSRVFDTELLNRFLKLFYCRFVLVHTLRLAYVARSARYGRELRFV